MADLKSEVATGVAPLATAEEDVRICLFRIGGDLYAVTVDVLAEIIIPQKIFPVPTTPSHLIGVISLRGNIVPIVDIRPAMSLPSATGIGQVAIIRHQQTTIGIVVDTVSEVVSVSQSNILPLPAEIAALESGTKSRNKFLQAIVQRSDSVAALLNIDRLLEAIAL